MPSELLSPHEFRVWHAFRLMSEDVLNRIGRDLAEATGLSGPEFGVLSRLANFCKGEMRQQALAERLGWDKSRLSHQLTRMEAKGLIKRHESDKRAVLVVLTKLGRKSLDAAMPVHAVSVRRNLLSRLTTEQIATIVRVSNLLGDEDEPFPSESLGGPDSKRKSLPLEDRARQRPEAKTDRRNAPATSSHQVVG